MTQTLLMLLALLGCSVDETGYLGGKDAEVDSDPASDAEADASPDVDGVRAPGAVYYTADEVLTAEPTDVTLLAVGGAFAGAERVTLTVAGQPQGVEARLVDGGFVEVLEAARYDEVRVAVDGETRLTVTLDALLDPVDAPDAGAVGSSHVLDGAVDVGDGALPIVPPYVAYVPETGGAARVDEGDVDVTLPAQAADTLCVIRVDSAGRTSPPACATLE